MLIKKIASSLDVITATCGRYRAQLITSPDSTPMMASKCQDLPQLYYDMPMWMARDKDQALRHIQCLEATRDDIEIFGDFTPEVVCHLRSAGYTVDLTPVPVFLQTRKQERQLSHA